MKCATLLLAVIFVQTADAFSSPINHERSGTIALQMKKAELPSVQETRRRILFKALISLSTPFFLSPFAWAQDADFVRESKDFSYSFTPPPGFEVSNKPLKTHLDEMNFVSSDLKGYQYGITVDPVKIASLKEFGTPQEVAAKVVLAEVNRDGVFDVTLVDDPVDISGFYLLNYLSKGKRGDKHFLCKICIQQGKLYVVTAQVKEEDYPEKKQELRKTVDTFRVI